ncbi:hypothetical protein HanXRQr2_Chr13g0603971 [Helianthus annuus]|uniref:Uncharacterized protein n=1 Tax=Helianthus annuus TaxID=4232 RepID=A0A9K3EL14_HELAN|nr:hypothetical protein HanXRQr2_Chr13g0603971 [Helianthus annuus]KAJ0850539.1 hypothetical protein HanPSC8_Chr13g0582001 [Helianthus annuus]
MYGTYVSESLGLRSRIGTNVRIMSKEESMSISLSMNTHVCMSINIKRVSSMCTSRSVKRISSMCMSTSIKRMNIGVGMKNKYCVYGVKYVDTNDINDVIARYRLNVYDDVHV